MTSMLGIARARAVRAGAMAVLSITLAVTLAVTLVAGLGAAPPATGAVANQSADRATGSVDRTADVAGYPVDVGDGEFAALATSLIGFRLADGTTLGVYCVEINTEIDDQQELVERPWEEFPDPDTPFTENQDRINWVLHHGFPVRDTTALGATLTSAGTPPTAGLDEREAITATQAAVWHFSDGTDLDRVNPLPGADSDDAAARDVLALYDHLTGPANAGLAEQPAAALEVAPNDLVGVAGDRIGPFTVTTTGTVDELALLAPEGVLVTDAAGTELDASGVASGTDLFLTVPADAAAGAATVELTATAVVDTGRLFVGVDHARAPTQSLIVARAAESTVTASAKASWTADTATAPQGRTSGGLASTGASVLGSVLLGIVLVATGFGTVLFVRRRRAG